MGLYPNRDLRTSLLAAPARCGPAEVGQVQALSNVQVTASHQRAPDPAGSLTLPVSLTAHAAAFPILEPAGR
jgi:hypothetical protein